VARVDLVRATDRGLYCAAGGFYIDPWRPVDRAVISHAHADHARPGTAAYLCTPSGAHVLRPRLGDDAAIETVDYGLTIDINGVRVSFHPAGHLLGSAQIRLEHRGEVWVVSGDYKTAPDVTCEPYAPVPCDVFITESTFGLPVYRWPPQNDVFHEIQGWWSANQKENRTSVLFVYALGKAQRVLGGIDTQAGCVAGHGAVRLCRDAYVAGGIDLPELATLDELSPEELRRALVLAPPSAQGSPWMRRFRNPSTAFASGWMQLRGPRRRRAVERGFVLSDHVDWPELLSAVEATGAERVGVTHGSSETVARWLRENGLDAWVLDTRFDGETGEDSAEEDAG
jgi:putative mRNA 3-end processing factor